MNEPFDEKEHAGPEHLDPDYVAKYDAKARTDPSAGIQHLKDFGLGADSVVVDLGAGSGTFAVAVAPHCKRVIAVDVSPAMISAMKSKVEDLGLTNVEIVEAGFLSFEAPSAPVDFVYSRHALHSLPDDQKREALKHVAALLKPGGIFYLKDLIYSFPKEQADTYFGAWLDAAPARPEDGWTREELQTHINTEFSPYSDVLEGMLADAGLEIKETTHRENKIFGAYTCRKK
jgi:ubiquinone/menaquinone biosynthesis C-methylase UbiE